MDIIHLISKTSGLLDLIKSIGLSSDQVAKIGGELTQQLRAQGEFDLSELIKEMDVQDFARRIDVCRLAESVSIGTDQVQAAVDLIAPVVEAFGLDSLTIVARMDPLASGLSSPN